MSAVGRYCCKSILSIPVRDIDSRSRTNAATSIQKRADPDRLTRAGFVVVATDGAQGVAMAGTTSSRSKALSAVRWQVFREPRGATESGKSRGLIRRLAVEMGTDEATIRAALKNGPDACAHLLSFYAALCPQVRRWRSQVVSTSVWSPPTRRRSGGKTAERQRSGVTTKTIAVVCDFCNYLQFSA
jgi:hypothetical protein